MPEPYIPTDLEENPVYVVGKQAWKAICLQKSAQNSQNGVLWKVDPVSRLPLPNQMGTLAGVWKIQIRDHPEECYEHAYADFDSAARQAYMRGWVYYRTFPEASFEIQVKGEPRDGTWKAKLLQSGDTVAFCCDPLPLKVAKYEMLKKLKTDYGLPDDGVTLDEIAQAEWEEKEEKT